MLAGQCKVVIVSASRTAAAVGAEDDDVVAVMPKPFDLDKLLGLVRGLVEQSNKENEGRVG